MPIDFPANPTNGQVFSNWIYDGTITAWRNVNTDTGVAALNTMGLRNVVPTSVSTSSGSATYNANGTVTFSGVTSIQLNGVFTSTYESYHIVFVSRKAASADSYLRIRMVTSGTPLTSGYAGGYTAFYSGGTTTNSSSSTTSFPVIQNFYSVAEFNGTISRPRVSGITELTTTAIGSNGASQIVGNGTTEISSGGTFDGIQIYTDASTISGTIKIYGYNN
jgi:hypothetical protein